MKILIKDCVRVSNYLYCIAKEINVVFKYDLTKNQIELLVSIPGEYANESEICGGIEYFDEKLILLPNKTQYIWIYDLVSKGLRKIEKKDMPHVGPGGMLQIIKKEDLLYLVGSSYPAIIRFETKSEKIDYITEPFKEVERRVGKLDDAYFRTHCAKVNNKVYFASCLDNYVLCFNLDNESYKWIKVGGEEQRFAGIDYDGEMFWLSPRKKGCIVLWDGEKKYKEIAFPKETMMGGLSYIGTVCYGNKVYIPNQCNPRTIVINKDKSMQIDLINQQILLMKKIGENEVIYQRSDGYTALINLNIEIELNFECELQILNDFYKENNLKIFGSTRVMNETETFNLDDFIEQISLLQCNG